MLVGGLALGAEAAFKKLVSCVSVQNIRGSSGLHPKLTGNSSGGKTWTVYSFAHHLPYEMVVKGSMSAKAGFYHSDGDRVLRILDDYQAGNEDPGGGRWKRLPCSCAGSSCRSRGPGLFGGEDA